MKFLLELSFSVEYRLVRGFEASDVWGSDRVRHNYDDDRVGRGSWRVKSSRRYFSWELFGSAAY